MNVITFADQSKDFFRKQAEENSDVLICLDSGTSFRQKIEPGYIPNPARLPTIRFQNIRFQRWTDLEAEDLKYLWLTKYIGRPEQSIKMVCKKILEGNPTKGIPTLLPNHLFLSDILPSIKLDWSRPKALDYISAELDIDKNDISRNYELTAKNMELYRAHIPDFDKLYKLI